MIWPAVSFGLVAAGYFRFGSVVFGKSAQGVLAANNQLLLLPYLVYLWFVWHLLRLLKTESAYDQINERITIGRRLLSHERPSEFDHVIDLTSEFTEPTALRGASYHSFQILDGEIPSVEKLHKWIVETDKLPGRLFIHCAEGHGRTGLFAAALLLHRGTAQTPDEALRFIQSKRPLVRLRKRQMGLLYEYHNRYQLLTNRELK